MPFELIKESFYEKQKVEKKLSREAARKLAAEKAYDQAIRQISSEAQIVNKTLNFVEKDGRDFASIVVECIEDIAVEQEIKEEME